MIKNRAHHAARYIFRPGERILVDANIWLFLQPPAAQPPPRYATSYSTALKNLLTAKAEPLIDALILSEYLNRFWQLEWRAWKAINPTIAPQFPTPKDFRKSAHFTPIGADAVANAKGILRLCQVKETPMHLADLNAMFAEFSAGTFDLNDGMIIENCRLSGWKLLTDDGDMTKGGIEVLTTNPKLINACPP
jgi:hypothetical protein